MAYSVYAPLYNAYRNECTRYVNGQPVGTGTVLAENAYALAFNYASSEGNKLRLEGVDAFEVKRQSDCARYGETSVAEEQTTCSSVRRSSDVVWPPNEQRPSDRSVVKPRKPRPSMVTRAPPLDEPTSGATDETVGAL